MGIKTLKSGIPESEKGIRGDLIRKDDRAEWRKINREYINENARIRYYKLKDDEAFRQKQEEYRKSERGKARINAAAKRYREGNREKINETYHRNRHKNRIRQRRYRENNRNRIRDGRYEYIQNTPIQQAKGIVRQIKYKEASTLRQLFEDTGSKIIFHYGWNSNKNPTYDYIAVLEKEDWFERYKGWINRELNDPLMILEGEIKLKNEKEIL